VLSELDSDPGRSGSAGAAGLPRDGGGHAESRSGAAPAAEKGKGKPAIQKTASAARKAVSVAGVVAITLGIAYTLDCRRYARGVEQLQSCYAFGGSIAGVGVGFSGARSSGFEQGFNTYNPSLRQPAAQRRKKEDEVS
jgi:hypothetical protein